MRKHFNFNHGHMIDGKRTPTYNSWRCMRDRCNRETDSFYHRYGGRGISYPKSWDNFSNFLRDMGERPEGKTLGRIKNDNSYSKDNCRWETAKQQAKSITKRKSNTGYGYISVSKYHYSGKSLRYLVCVPTIKPKVFFSLKEAIEYRNENLPEKLKKNLQGEK